MAIVQSETNISYTEKVIDRTKKIEIKIDVGCFPEINITRERVTYRDGVQYSIEPIKDFIISAADLAALNKLSLITDIADVIDQVSLTK